MINDLNELIDKVETELGARVTECGYKDFRSIKDHRYIYFPNGYKASILHEFAPYHISDVLNDWGWELMLWDPLRDVVDLGTGDYIIDSATLDEIYEALAEIEKMKFEE